jgi:hypothetical protein
LGIPLELEDDGLDSLKMEHLTWSCLLAHAWWRQLQILPHTPLWEILAPYSKCVDQTWLHSLHIDSINFAILLLFFLAPDAPQKTLQTETP